MDAPTEMLEKLKCFQCDYYLSCGPVYIRPEDGEAICGRCGKPEKEPIIQNKQYEAVAEHLRFPCKYSEFGCLEKLKFSQNNQNRHEENCDFRRRLCPIVERGKCDWLGTWKDLLQHCKADHPQLVLENPCSFGHDISKSSLINYLLVAFNLLFILHTKVCCTSGKIFHAIRLLGDSERAEDFEYQLDIKRKKEHLSKSGKVAPEGCLAIQENIALVLGVNNLLEFLNGFDDTVFHITLKKLKVTYSSNIFINFGGMGLNRFQNQTGSSPRHLCIYCDREISSKFPFGATELCRNCIPIVKYCVNQNKGCAYFDVKNKCLKHEKFFCKFVSKCTLCNRSILDGTIFLHLEVFHKLPINEFGKPYIINPSCPQHVLFTSDFGTIFIYYNPFNRMDAFKIYTHLSSKELKFYKCMLITGGHYSTILSSSSNDVEEDWSGGKLSGRTYMSFKIEKVS